MTDRLHTWRMVPDRARTNGFRMEEEVLPMPPLGAGDALVRVAGCGVCGTDLGYFFDAIPTASPPPLTLGHEVAGVVVEGPSAVAGKEVIVPTIFPCRRCEMCRSGRANRCLRQRMLGGNFDRQGGFSSHIVVPAADLCPIPAGSPLGAERLAVVADAVATPYQACLRADIGEGDKIIVIGATGGLGVYAVQWARLLGAEMVVGIARDKERLALMARHGVDLPIPLNDDSNVVRREIWRHCKERGVNPRYGWKVLEVSGTLEGQRLALELLTYTSRLVLVGFAEGEIPFQFSRLMAMDAEVFGSWGCDPRRYPEVLSYVLAGRIDILPFTETRAMGAIEDVFAEMRQPRRGLTRTILIPDW